MSWHYLVFTLGLLLLSGSSSAQISQRTNEGSDLPINPVTGVASTAIPLYSISDYDITHNVSIQYSGGGIPVEQVSDWLGLGWSMNTGGYVQRVVRGLPDDSYPSNGVGYGYYIYHGNTGGDDLGVAEGKYDTEPDLYVVVFNGRTAQFFFDDEGNVVWKNMEPFIIEPKIPHTGQGFKYWEFTDDFGNKYLFGWDQSFYYWHEEVSFLTSDNQSTSDRIKQKWFLTEMTTAQGHLVEYNYSPEEYRVWSVNKSSLTIRAGGTPLEYQQDESIMYNLIGRDVVTHRLEEVVYPNYKVKFNSLFARSDVDIDSDLDKYGLTYEPHPPKALSNIKVTNKHNNACVSDIWLDHEDIVASIDQFENEENWIPEFSGSHYPDKLRMFLESVSYLPCESTCETEGNSVVLDYYNRDLLSRRITYTQDLWGYCNGAVDNTTLVPSWQVGGEMPMVVIDAADRDPDLTHTQAGALKSVEFPTGLKTEFIYELNEALCPASNTKQYQVVHDDFCVREGIEQCAQTGMVVVEDVHFNEVFDLQLDISITQNKILIEGNPVVVTKIFKRYNQGSWTLAHQFDFEAVEEQDAYNWSRSGEQLKTILNLELNEVFDLKIEATSAHWTEAHLWVKAIYNDQDQLPEPKNIPVGGLRIKEVTTGDLKRTYEYNMSEEGFPSSQSSEIIDWHYWNFATLPCTGSYQPVTHTNKIGSFTFNSLMEVSADINLQVLGELSCTTSVEVIQIFARRKVVSDVLHEVVIFDDITQIGQYHLSNQDLLEKGLVPGFEYEIFVHHPERVIMDVEFFGETIVPLLDPSKNWSSGKIVNFPVVAEAYYTDLYFNESELVYELHSESPILSNYGSQVLYSQVTERLNDGELGSNVYYFQPVDHWDIDHFHMVPVSGCIPVVTELPLGTFVNLKPMTGRAIRSEVYDKQGNMDRSSNFEYKVEEDLHAHDVYQNVTFFQTYSVEVLHVDTWPQYLLLIPEIGPYLYLAATFINNWLGGNTAFVDIDGVQVVPYKHVQTINSTFCGVNKVTTEEFGITSISQLEYRSDLAHLNPIQITQSVEGHADQRITEILYADDANATDLNDEDINFVSVPLYTLIDGGAGGGSKTDFEIVGGRILPVASYRAMDDGETWKELSRMNVQELTSDGLPKEITRYATGIPEEYVYYGTLDNPHLTGLVKEVTYGDRKTEYTYHPNRMIKSLLNHEGIVSEYTYDGLNRICQQIGNNGRLTTGYTYTLGSAPDWKNKMTSTTTFRNTELCETAKTTALPNWVSDSYFDVYGRNTSVERLLYTQEPASYTTGLSFDPLGKVLEDCDPGKGGCDIYGYTESPLRRLDSIQPAGSTKWILVMHGSNDASVIKGSINYSANTLYKTSITDENGIVTDRYTNFKGLAVLECRDPLGLDLRTYYRYDKRDNVVEVYPPASGGDGDPVNFIYEYYTGGVKDGLLFKKSVPDEGTAPGDHGVYVYDYSDREQVESETLPNGNDMTYVYNEPYFDFLESVKVNDVVVRSYVEEDNTFSRIQSESIQVVDGTNVSNLSTSYSYDDIGRVLTETRGFLGGTSNYTYCYDDANNVRLVTRVHDFDIGVENDIQFQYQYDMSNGIRVDAVHLNLGGMDVLSELTYNNNDWLVGDKVGDGLHTISYDYNPRGWLERINSVEPPPPATNEDCEPGPYPVPPYIPQCIEIGSIFKILYNCAAISAGDTTTVLISVQNGQSYSQTPIALNGSDGTETDQSENFEITITSNEDIELLEAILQNLLASCFTSSGGSIKGQYDLNALINQILSKLAEKGGDLFGERIHYFKGNSTLQAPPQWNGNVSWMEWKVAGEPYQVYGFQYDAANRLTQALYQSKITRCEDTNANYDCYFGYDARGNINSITRYGFKGLGSNNFPTYDIIDNLTYIADGANMVSRVDDSADPYRGFLGTYAEYENSYGRLDNDLGVKAASVTEYNFLNQPVNINRGSKPNYTHAYDAYGNMQKQVTYDENDDPHIRLFHDGIEYYDGKIQAVYHAEGRYVFERWVDGSLKRNYHEYMIRDHLGNTRVRFADLNGDKRINIVNHGPGQGKEILGSYHYYPYGMKMEGIFHKQDLVNNSYQYNGIDYLPDGRLNVNFATWRTLDPAIGRWWQSDPMADYAPGHSPFNSMWNNPISYNDPNGDFPLGFFVGFAIGAAVTGLSVAGNDNLSTFEEAGLTLLGGIAGGLLGEFGPGIISGIGSQGGAAPIIVPVANTLNASSIRPLVNIWLTIDGKVTSGFINKGIGVANSIWELNGYANHIQYHLISRSDFDKLGGAIDFPDAAYRAITKDPANSAFRQGGNTVSNPSGKYILSPESYINVTGDIIRRNVNAFGHTLAHETLHTLMLRFEYRFGEISLDHLDGEDHFNSYPNLLYGGRAMDDSQFDIIRKGFSGFSRISHGTNLKLDIYFKYLQSLRKS